LSYLANTQTNKQTKSGKNITSLAEVFYAFSAFQLTAQMKQDRHMV